MADKAKALMQALWKKAYDTGQVEIQLKSKEQAIYMRFQMYNAVKAVKKNPALDHELALAAENCSVSLGKGEMSVIVKKKAPTEELLLAALAAGIDVNQVVESPQDETELAARESQRRMEELLAGGQSDGTTPDGVKLTTGHIKNRFYDRTKG